MGSSFLLQAQSENQLTAVVLQYDDAGQYQYVSQHSLSCLHASYVLCQCYRRSQRTS
jgi:hypothetical protein